MKNPEDRLNIQGLKKQVDKKNKAGRFWEVI